MDIDIALELLFNLLEVLITLQLCEKLQAFFFSFVTRHNTDFMGELIGHLDLL